MRRTIPLDKIVPNPWRDFNLYPIDPEQVERLRSSIHDTGFWLGVQVRPKPGEPGMFELAFGHHRLEAARAEGVGDVAAEVLYLDDDTMLRIMTTENATQRVHNAAAALDSVAAISRRLAYILLRHDYEDVCRITQTWAKSRKSFETQRGKLLSGEGVGRDAIRAFAPEGALRRHEIESALGALKDGGKMAEILADVQARIEAEREREERERAEAAERERQEREEAERRAREREEAARVAAEEARRAGEEAEQRRREAEQRAAEAKEAQEKAAAAKAVEDAKLKEEELRQRREATERLAAEEREREERERQAAERERLRREAEEARGQEELRKAIQGARDAAKRAADDRAKKEAEGGGFDVRVANLFRNDHQLNTFRGMVTDGINRQYISLDEQFQLAQDIIGFAKERRRELTGVLISGYIRELVAARSGAAKQDDARLASQTELVKAARHKVNQSRNSWGAGCAELVKLFSEGAPVPFDLDRWLREIESSIAHDIAEIRRAAGVARGGAIIEGKARENG